MVRIRIALGLVLLVLAGMPASEPEPAVPAPQPESSVAAPWAQEAVEWFEARDEAVRLGIANLLRFVAPAVVHDDGSPAEVVGRAEYGAHLQRGDHGVVDEGATELVYLDVTGALVEGLPSTERGGLTAVEIDHGMITREREAGDAQDAWFFDTPENVAARAFARAYLRAWSSQDPDAIRALYAPGADLVDALLGLEVSGADAIVDLATQGAAADMSLVGEPATTVGAETDVSVFSRRLHAPNRPEVGEVFILAPGDDGYGCPGRTGIAVGVSGGLIVSERRYHEIDSMRRCWDTELLPDGWWTGLEAPAPYQDVVTGTVRAAGQRIEIHNGSAALERLVRWAMARFETAGLPAPSVESVTFDEVTTAPQCAVDRTGLTIHLGASSQLFVCLGETEACANEACTSFAARARLLVLHELAHAWMPPHVDEGTQEAFMDHMGVAAWSSAEVGWYDRGVEQAAQVLAWGLMDEPITTARLPEASCGQLVEGFRVLTGERPLVDACAARG